MMYETCPLDVFIWINKERKTIVKEGQNLIELIHALDNLEKALKCFQFYFDMTSPDFHRYRQLRHLY